MFSLKRLVTIRGSLYKPAPAATSTDTTAKIPSGSSHVSPAITTSTSPAKVSARKRFAKGLKKAWGKFVAMAEDILMSYSGMVNDPEAHRARTVYSEQRMAAIKSASSASKPTEVYLVVQEGIAVQSAFESAIDSADQQNENDKGQQPQQPQPEQEQQDLITITAKGDEIDISKPEQQLSDTQVISIGHSQIEKDNQIGQKCKQLKVMSRLPRQKPNLQQLLAAFYGDRKLLDDIMLTIPITITIAIRIQY